MTTLTPDPRGGWTAVFGEIPMLAAGQTRAEAVAALEEELEGYLDEPHLLDPPGDDPDRVITRADVDAAIKEVRAFATDEGISMTEARRALASRREVLEAQQDQALPR